MLSHVEAQIQTAGTLFVDVDATTVALGSLQSVTNKGTLAGSFTALGGAAATPVIAQVGGAKAIQMDGGDYLQLADDTGTPILAPAELTGENPTRSIEVWALNPAIDGEETLVSWGKRGGGDGTNMSFNYGSDFRWGAVGHWGNRDIGWNNTGGGPAAGKWHHLVYTMDGNTTRLYVDGKFNNGEYLGDGAINTHPDTPLLIGAQTEGDGTTITGGLRFTGSIGRVRIHDGVLTAAQVANNYDLEKGTFTDPTGPAPLAPERIVTGPIHRYSFSEAAGAATGAVDDSVGTADGVVLGEGAAFTGSRLALPGGGSATAPYVDLPNGLLSKHAVANGGTGKFSIESWVKVTGARAWGRIFDFGSSGTVDATEEVLGPGGGGEGRDYFMYSGSNGADTSNRRLEIRNEDPAGGGGGLTVDNGTTTFNQDVHVLVTWDEATGRLVTYEDGRQVSTGVAAAKMSDINDVNVWLGRSNWAGDQNLQGEYDEVRIYDYVIPPAVALGNAQAGPDQLNNHDFAPSFANSPKNASAPQGQPASFKVDVYGSSPLTLQWYRDDVLIPNATNRTYSIPSVTINDNNAVFTVKASNTVSGTPTTVTSAGGTLTVVPPTDRLAAAPAHRWSFNNAAGDATAAEVLDSIGTAHGLIQGDGATFSGSRVVLPGGGSGSAAYVDLPNGLLSSHGVANGGSGKFTIETWFKVTGTQNWGRIFDFGSSGSAAGTDEVLGPGGAGEGRDYLMYSASTDVNANNRRLEVRNEDPAGGGITTVDNPTATFGKDTHVAVTWDEATGRLTVYENGVQVSTMVTDDKMSDINDVNVWLGRSNWGGDNNMQGEFDEVRIYDAVLSQRQVLGNIQAGNGVINDRDIAPTIVGDPQSVTLPEGGDLLLTANAQGSTPLAFQWLRNGQPIPGQIGTTLSIPNVTAADNNASFTFRVSNTVNGQPASATSAAAVLTVTPAVFELRHRYSFSETEGAVVTDSVGAANGELVGAGAILGGGKATLDGTDGYVNLPNGVISGLGVDGTIEIWFSNESPAIWSRVFDFGVSTDGEDATGTGEDFLFFTAREADGFPRFTANFPGGGDVATLVPLPPGWVKPHDETYVAITWSASKNTSRMYIDGVLVSTATAPRPLSALAGKDLNNWLGRAQFNDPFWSGSYNELRLTAGALKPEQVLASYNAGPDAGVGGGSPTLAVTRSGNNITITWPASATGFTLQSTPVLGPGATWTTAGTGTANGSNLEVTLPIGTGNAFFRLMKP
jgi:hypothetical protein